MKREELKALGLSDEQVDKVISMNGRDIEKYKNVEAENESLKTQAEANAKSLNELQEKVKGNEDLTKQVQDMKDANAKAEKDFKERIKQMSIDNAVDSFLSSKRAKNSKAAKALIDMDKVTYDEGKNVVSGLEEQWESIYKGNEYLFDATGNPTKTGADDSGKNLSGGSSAGSLSDALHEHYKK